MSNWNIINELKYLESWDFIFDRLHFKPFEKEELISLPSPTECFDFTSFYNDEFSEKLYDNLHECALSWFKKINQGSGILALNWQHNCYSFNPELAFEKDEFNEWPISVFPNGDFVFFLTRDFKNGVFADGINFTFNLWGKEMIENFENAKPTMAQ